ncbi:MAG: sulfatase-like hydrolase/transferase [Planctomycetota bacterium]|jgi:arylsulfatase A-like enzyme
MGKTAILTFSLLSTLALPAQQDPANVVVIVSDDAGYADFSMHGSEQMRTPRIDSIAANGVRFAQGYVSASVCSPSRAGLMTGRYQQRFGHERNIPPRYSEENGLPVDEVMLPAQLQAHGYRTIGLGKWHLGYAPKFHPLSRGFDDFYGFLQGARSYWPLEQPTRLNRLLRDREVLPEDFEYLTDSLATEAARYIEEHQEKPFFLYLSFNAVHTPMHAKESELAKHENVRRQRRRKLAAMTSSLDEGVGRVLDALRENGLWEKTLLIFLNDNGGANNNASINLPLRGSKGTLFEGGVRVPFVMQWPSVLPEGTVYEDPVISLDLLPTALAVSGATQGGEKELDGVNLMPYLLGDAEGRPHELLFWRHDSNRAVRRGDLKLISMGGEPWMLFDLAKDPREQTNLAKEREDVVAELAEVFASWNAELAEPRWNYGR